MNIFKTTKSVLLLIGRNKMRSFLTMLGIIIGIMAVIIIMSVGAGAQSLIINQIKSMGTNLVGILPGKTDEKGPPASVYGITITTLKYDDINAIMSKNNPHILAVAVYVRGMDTVHAGERKTDTTFIGTTSGLPDVEDTGVQSGRFFSSEEERTSARVAVLGHQVAQDLFFDENPIGRIVRIKKTNFNVIGVMKKRGTMGFQNQDNQIYVPITTAQKLLLGIDYISMARVKIDDEKNIDQSIQFMEDIIRDRHNINKPADDDFTIQSMALGVDALTNVTNALRLFLTFIATIALLVGGIGIMNIMLAAVEERTREIGLRKALGARKRHIISQFLIETTMITLMGGIIGIILGVLISFVTARTAQNMGYNWDFIISPLSILLAAGVSITIGIIFGLAPANKASKLDPVEALRYE
jgi:putative ABC transport system permease protein